MSLVYKSTYNISEMLSEPTRCPPVNLYITELWILFVGHGTIEIQFSSRQGKNQQSKNWLSME
jgi:hypothetical protein